MFAIFLLVLLFLIGFINTIFHIPPKKLFLWIQSFILNNPKQDYFKEDKEEEKNIKKMSNNGVINGTIDDKKSLRNRDLERVFATFDKNGDGFITKEELRDSLKNIGFFTSESEVGIMVGNLDVNGDGLIDIEEFYELYESIMGKKNKKEKVERVEEDQEEEEDEDEEEEELREAFHVFDGDKDGLISVEELSTVLKSLGLKQGIRFEECKEMIKKVDMDGDGMVSFDEFKLMMKSGTNLVQLVS